MKSFLLIMALTLSITSFTQDEGEWKEASKESQAYHKYRAHLSYPPYGLDKVNLLIRKQVITDSFDNLVLKDATYNSLSLREKFTYNMIHGESYSQNCDAMPPIQNEQTKIFSYLPDAFNEFAWSERQEKYFSDDKDSVLALMRQCIKKNNRVGVNFKQAILLLNATDMIPFLVKTYRVAHKDYDILTLLMLLMKENKYEPFLNSASYKKMYDENSNYQAFLKHNKANEDLILQRATDYYNGIKR